MQFHFDFAATVLSMWLPDCNNDILGWWRFKMLCKDAVLSQLFSHADEEHYQTDEPKTGKSAVATAPPVAGDWGNQCSVQEQRQTPPLHPPVPNWNDWKAVSHTHTPLQHFYKHQRFLSPKMCPLDGFSASWVNWQYLTAGVWGQAMLYLVEPQARGRCVWLWLSGVFTLGWKPQA